MSEGTISIKQIIEKGVYTRSINLVTFIPNEFFETFTRLAYPANDGLKFN